MPSETMSIITGSGDEMLTYAQASQLLGIGVSTLYAMVSRQTLPFFRVGPRLVRFSRRQLVQWLEASAVAPKVGGER